MGDGWGVSGEWVGVGGGMVGETVRDGWGNGEGWLGRR